MPYDDAVRKALSERRHSEAGTMIGSVIRPANCTSLLSRQAVGDQGITTSVYPVRSYLRGMGAALSEADIGAIRTARANVPDLPTGFRFHDLRHYMASLLIADVSDVKTARARLRHASAKTTLDTYGHLWPDRDESTRATIEAVFANRRTEQGLNQQSVP